MSFVVDNPGYNPGALAIAVTTGIPNRHQRSREG